MNQFSDNTREAFELYAKRNLKKALSSLPADSQHWHYLKMIDSIKKESPKLKKKTKKMIEDYLNTYNSYSTDELADSIISWLVRIEEFEFLKKLSNNNLGLSFTHEKPYYAVNRNQDRSEVLGPSSWDQDTVFNDKKEIEKVYNDYYSVNLHKSLLNDVDYSKIQEQAMDNLISSSDTLATFTNKSFIKALAKIFTKRYNDKNHGRYLYNRNSLLRQNDLEANGRTCKPLQ